jgi:hypothetical protein
VKTLVTATATRWTKFRDHYLLAMEASWRMSEVHSDLQSRVTTIATAE